VRQIATSAELARYCCTTQHATLYLTFYRWPPELLLASSICKVIVNSGIDADSTIPKDKVGIVYWRRQI